MSKRGNIHIYIAFGILGLFLIVSFLSPLIAGRSSIFCPAGDSKCLLPLLHYDGSTIHTDRKHIVPFTDMRHILGTDILGRDVFAGLIGGTQKSLLIGILTSFFSGIIGCFLGMAAGYFGNNKIRISNRILLLWILILPLLLFYCSYELLVFDTSLWVWLISMIGGVGLLYLISKLIGGSKKSAIQIDLLVTKLIEVRKSIPSLFLILAILPLFTSPTIWNIVAVLTIFMWTEFARLSRSEVLRISGENYIKRVEQLGISSFRLMTRHFLPNMLPTILVVFCFSCAACILAESSISFLGIGLGPEEVTWGSMLAQGRKTMVWWMIVWPGLCIFALIWSLNTIASYYQTKY
jgi:peptide/nickel transport system permease protein